MASSFSSVLSHSRCGFSLRFLSTKPQASFSRFFRHRTRRSFRKTFPLTLTLSRSFSQDHLSSVPEGPSLRHFIAQASLTASEAQPKSVIPLPHTHF
ncbi:CDK5RAP1-like protein [Fagus crenata]